MATNGFGKTLDRLRAQKRAAATLDRTRLRVGWIDGARTLDGRTAFAVIARTLCYGREAGTTRTGRSYPAIPARNFMKTLSETRSGRIEMEARKAFARILTAPATEGEAALARMLAPVGAVASGELRQAVGVDRYQPNARSTVLSWARRHSGSTKQMRAASKLAGESRYQAFAGMKKELVDTGAMIQHITYDIVKK